METKQSSATIIVHPATIEYYNNRKSFLHVKPYSPSELAEIYGVCSRTFKKWIQPFQGEIGKREGRFFSVRQVKIIFLKLDIPYMMEVA